MLRKLGFLLALGVVAGCNDNRVSTGVVIIVQTATTGVNLDDQYIMTLNGAGFGTIGPNQQQIFGLAEGRWTLGLDDVATNCTVTDNPQTIEVALPSALVEFEIICI